MTKPQWKKLVKKTVGITTPTFSYRFPPEFHKALQQLAKQESREGNKVSAATIIMNLCLYGDSFYRAKSVELRQIYEKLNKELSNVTTHTKEPSSTQTD